MGERKGCAMTAGVVCLRPEADFTRVGVTPPASLDIAYRAPDDASLPSLLREADALVIPAVGPKLAPELFDGTCLKLIQVTGAGVDRLDRPSLERLGIPVANVPGGSNAALAEYATTAASLLLRRLASADDAIRRGDYAAFRARLLADNVGGLEGALVGIVGLGTVGLAVARAFRAAGGGIVYHDPAPADPAAADALGAERVSLEDLLARADVVSLHVPLLPETRNLIGAAQLRTMKPGAVLIQASRGGVVDEAALAEALRSGHLGGAAVDVYSAEPPPADHPLLMLTGEAAERMLLTPHIAGVTRQSAAFLFRSAWENIERVLVTGEPPLHRVY
jgi:phosphoglycerate dehydrogenase-like enzyme